MGLIDLDLGIRRRGSILNSGRRRRAEIDGGLADQLGEELLNRRQASSTSGLDYLLDSIDKFTGARALRGIVTGKPREALSILPGSDVLGITRPEQQTSTEELSGKLGLPTEGFGGLLSNIGVGIAFDPTTYLTFGGKAALTAGGKLAKAAGALDDVGDAAKAANQSKRAFLRGSTISDLAAADPKAARRMKRIAKKQGLDWDEMLASKESLAGAMNVGLPFTAGRVLGKEKTASGLVGAADKAFGMGEEFIGSQASRMGKKALKMLPESAVEIGAKAGRELKSGFNTAYGNVSSAFAQPRMPGLVKAKKVLDLATRRSGRQLTEEMRSIASEAGVGPGQEMEDWLSLVVEGQNPASVKQFAHLDPELGEDALAFMETTRRGWNDMNSALYKTGFSETRDATEKGLDRETLVPYSPRSTNAGKQPPSLGAAIAGIARTSRPADISRKDWTKGGYELEGGGRGRYALNKLTQDTTVWDASRSAYGKIRDGQAMLKSYADEGMQAAGQQLIKEGREQVKAVRTMIGEKYVGLTPQRVEELTTERGALGKQIDDLKAAIKEAQGMPEVPPTLDMDVAALEMAQTAADWIDHKLGLPAMAAKKLGRDLPVQYRGKPLYDDALADIMRHEMTSGRKLLTGKWVMEAITDAAVPINPDASTMGSDKFVSVYQALNDARFSTGGQVNSHAIDNLAEKLSTKLGLPPEAAKEMILNKKFAIDKQVAKDMSKVMSVFGGDKEDGGWLGLYDEVTRAFKMGVTQYWPAFHVRNRFTAAAMNWMFDAGDETQKGYAKYTRPFQDAARFRAGEVIKGLGGKGWFKQMDDEQATRALGNIAWDNGLTEGAGEGSELLRSHEVMNNGIFGGPGRSQQTIKGALAPLAQPPKTKGLMNQVGEMAGRANTAALGVGNSVEMDNRMAALIGLLKSGWDPQAAAARVKELHIDYGDLTGFERGTMRRMIPFYTYTRKMLPMMMEELIKNPGGKAAQLAKAGRNMRGDSFLPEHIAGGMAIPWGDEDEEGNQRFLTGLDMPFELINEVFRPGHSGLQTFEQTAQKLLGMANPLVKAPAELVAGKQFFSGRDLQTLDGNDSRLTQNLVNLPFNLGNLFGGDFEQPMPVPNKSNILIEQLIAASPASRAVSTAKTLTDPRKWEDPLFGGLPIPTALIANLGTGARFSDVNIPQQQDLMAREMLSEQLMGLPGVGTFEKAFIKPEAVKGLSDEDMETYLLYNFLEKEAQRKGRARKKKKQAEQTSR